MMDISEEVDDFIQQIEKKYNDNSTPTTGSEKQLHLLSEEFVTLGLPPIDFKENRPELLEQITNNAFLLVQLHRKTLAQLTNSNINGRFKETRNEDLGKIITDLKSQNAVHKRQNIRIEQELINVKNMCADLKKTISLHNDETNKIKQYYKSKEDQLIHGINRLENENQRLKELCNLDIDKYFSKDDKYLKVLKQYKRNEEIYKSSLHKLEENNAEIMNEILKLKEELIVAYASNK